MSVAAWPENIPFINDPNSFRESGPVNNVIRSDMESGPIKSRKRFTAAYRTIGGRTDIISNADVSVFETWFNDTIGSGALPFTAAHPRTGVEEKFMFSEPYKVIFIKDDLCRIEINLSVLP